MNAVAAIQPSSKAPTTPAIIILRKAEVTESNVSRELSNAPGFS